MSKPSSYRIIYAGTPEFAVPPLLGLLNSSHQIIAVYTQPDRPAGRGQQLTLSPVKKAALENHIPIYQPMTLKDEKEQKTLSDLKADLMVVAAYGLILPKSVLISPRLGCINIHPSLLPRWRGAAPIQRALLAGDKETGITMMKMEEGLDSGPILFKKTCALEKNITTPTLTEKLAELGKISLLETLEQLEILLKQAKPQEERLVTYAHKMTKEEAKIDWSLPAETIHRQIRAFQPWPVSWTSLEDQTIRLFAASVGEQEKIKEKPGTIVKTTNQAIEVATGSGVLSLEKLQLPGGKIMSVRDLLNAKTHLFKVGMVLK